MTDESRLPCWACFKLVARHGPPGIKAGKRRRAHQCPHGVACISGSAEGAQGYNGPPLGGKHYCRPCLDAHKAYWRGRENKLGLNDTPSGLPPMGFAGGLGSGAPGRVGP